MPRSTPWQSDYTRLCERCGYILEQLDLTTNCPECGRPIAESHYTHRTGTPWQQDPNWWTFIRTNLAMLRHPIRMFDVLQIDAPAARQYLGAVAGASAFLAFPALLLGWLSMNSFHARLPEDLVGEFCYSLLCNAMVAIIWSFLVQLLIRVEWLGIRFFGRQRGWRISRTVASSVCAVASVGWLLVPLLIDALFLLGVVLRLLGLGSSVWTLLLATVGVAWPLLSVVIGMVVFETLVYIGVRRCRFANHTRTFADV